MTAPSNAALAGLIQQIDEHLAAGADGLPEELFLFVSRITPLINVDLLIKDDAGRTLLTWRSDRFYGSGWHIPGGIIRHGEPAARRIRMVAQRELAAEVSFDPSPIHVLESIVPGRRERGHFISLLYRCRLLSGPDPELRCSAQSPLPGQWCWHERYPHNLIREQNAYAALM
jgi:ADP-ribose pyrophosphatase YjhB (NUDIX family)